MPGKLFPSFFWCLVLLISSFTVRVAEGQDIRLEFQNTPLIEALDSFREITGVDVVYSPQMAEYHRTSCIYAGRSVREALICIVTGLPFRTQEVSRSQFVLIPFSTSIDTSTERFVFSGFVVDAQSQETLIGAHLLLPGIGAGTVTNDAGFFAFPGLPGRAVEVQVSYLGFSPLDTTLVVDGEPVLFALRPSTSFLEDVVIEESSSQRADLVVTPGLLTLPPSELAALPGSLGGHDVLEALRWMPGIERAGEATGGLLVRGSGPDQNLYLIDGAPVYHPWHAFSLVSTFQTDTFKDISFYRGSFPAEYGGRLSAVLDAELRDGARTEPRATFGISALNANFLIESPISPSSSFMLSGRRSYIDKLLGRNHPVEDDFGRRDTLRTGYYFYDWSAKLSHRPDPRSNFSISYYSGRDALDLRLPFDLSLDFSSWLRPADLFFEVDQSWGNRIVSARYRRLVNDKIFITATGYSSNYSAAENTFIQPTQTASVRSQYNVNLEDLGTRFDLDYYPTLRHQIRVGAALVHHRFSSTIKALVAYSPSLSEPLEQYSSTQTTEAALYIQDFWKPSPSLRILPGIRLSFFGKEGVVQASPRITAQYAVHPTNLVVRASASTHVQYLQRIRDRHSYLYDLVSSRWVPSGNSTRPSRSGQITAGVESRALKRTTIKMDVFARGGRGVLLPKDEFQSKDGLLGPGIEITTLLGQYTEGLERSYGTELSIDTSWKRWKVLSSYTGMRAENRARNQSEEVFYPTRFDVPRSFSMVGHREAGKWKTGFALIWRSGYPITVPVSRYQLEDPISGESPWYYHRPDLNNGRLPAYFRLDLNMAYGFHWGSADWSVGINLYNAINRRNVVGQTFDPARETFSPKDRLGLPLLPLFDLKMEI